MSTSSFGRDLRSALLGLFILDVLALKILGFGFWPLGRSVSLDAG